MSPDSTRNYYRIACEFQVRFRVIDDDELEVFQNYALRPAPYSSLKTELEAQLRAMDIREESKFLFEKAFQLLINIDQRLERIEEQLVNKEANLPENYEWVHGDLGAGGLAFSTESDQKVKEGQKLLVDVILPSLPEYRFVAAAQALHTGKKGQIGVEFTSIHEDDREYIHRFVIQKERELLRARAIAKESSSENEKPKK